ncbi:alpha-amylase family glycosyl hydrolase [Coraliomargarita parva]|uniref:alpha-amylase family glycosyl hydrolase n=1 Tax=Coraliomargarita parva TaxID=3014050 RepID=UPI0022B51A5F|nr:alpha-amylase family glycosyl hydrolase [Coraliomargarita parva]
MQAASRKIAHAFWESKDSGIIILSKDWRSTTSLPPLLLGPRELRFRRLERLSPERSGRYCRYFRRKNSWYFTIQSQRYPELLDRKVRVFLGGDFNGWGDAIGQSQWELLPDTDAAETTYELRVPLKLLPRAKVSQFKFVTEDGVWLDAPESAPNRVYAQDGVCNFVFNPDQSGKHIFRFESPAGYEPVGNEKIIWTDGLVVEVHELPHTQFLTMASSGLPMGAEVRRGRTTFRLFAPRAKSVAVGYGTKPDGTDFSKHALQCSDAVSWELEVAEDLSGSYYWFYVDGDNSEGTAHFDGSFPVLDPYAKACLGHRGPGIVVSPERLQKSPSQFQGPAWHDMVIMEAHIRDLACHAPIELTARERMGYAGVRKWLKAEASYLREIGVNTIELQPIQEFDNRAPEDYHWGYMTVNYFSPESSYAQSPESASQVEEFKALVRDFHDEGMALILDVVYNHVGEPNHLLFIDKFYYFHTDEANDLVNWSGCGNDLRCDTPMARRLIVESLKHLVEVYDVDGFRFDLAELIGIEVLREIEKELKAIKPTLVLIAEPWSFRGHIQDELRETGFASWNDGFRESMAKYICGNGNQEGIAYFLSGSPSTSRFVAQSINYTESHDDYCWLDRITERPKHDGSNPTVLDRRRTHLMAAVLFASLGVPMISAGQDFLRSKRGIHNTYQRGDLNALDYNQRLMYAGTHAYFSAWIRFRLSSEGEALRYNGGLRDGYMQFYHVDGSSAVLASYNHDRSRNVPRLLFGVNPHFEYASIECEMVGDLKFVQIADHERFDPAGLKVACIPLGEGRVHLPPLSCGLWIVQG